MVVWSRQLSGVFVTAILTTSGLCRAGSGDDVLPPPPDARALDRQAVFHLALVVNHYETQKVVAVTRRGGDFFVASADLQQAGLPAEQLAAGEVNLSRMTQVKVDYDSSGQRLLLSVPREWLPVRSTPFGGESPTSVARNGSGALLNYDVYASSTQDGDSQASVWHELRFFNDAGSLSSTGYVRQNLAGDDDWQDGYVRYDTVFTATHEENATQWQVGDVITDALSWSNSVRVGGISWGRDFSLRPDLVTWPLPAFSGEAAVPTAVDLFINGYRAGSTELQPGLSLWRQ